MADKRQRRIVVVANLAYALVVANASAATTSLVAGEPWEWGRFWWFCFLVLLGAGASSVASVMARRTMPQAQHKPAEDDESPSHAHGIAAAGCRPAVMANAVQPRGYPALMNLFSIWPEFGFRENPYSNAGLPGDETGDFLLTGRDREVAELQRKIGSTGTQPAVEGLAGVGKSSLVSVAGYRMFRRCIEAEEGTLFLPARRLFQASNSAQAFEDEVFREVAQTLISNVRAFDKVGLQAPDLGGLDKWLNVPQYRNWAVSRILDRSSG